MEGVSSYRDPVDPESVHFPGSFASRFLLIVVDFVCILTIITVFLVGAGWTEWRDIALVLTIVVVTVAMWPRRICVDDMGVAQFTLFGRRRRFIQHGEMGQVVYSPELPLLARVLPRGVVKSKIIVPSASGSVRIVHTPLHSDRERFLSELRRRGADVEEID